MRSRYRERIKSAVAAVAVLAYFLWAAGWAFTLGFAGLCAAVWYFGHRRPLTRLAKQAKRRTR